MALVWTAVVAGIDWTAWQRDFAMPVWVLVFGGFCNLVALLLLWAAAQQTVEWARYGDVGADVTTEGSIGGRLTARAATTPGR